MEDRIVGLKTRETYEIPAAETIGIADDIRGSTQGRAFFGYEFEGFSRVPASLEEDLIMEIRKRKGMPLEMPNKRIMMASSLDVDSGMGSVLVAQSSHLEKHILQSHAGRYIMKTPAPFP